MRSAEFASDNTAGVCPEALQAMLQANVGRVPSYGLDDWTKRACDALRQFFETDCEVFFVFNGTAANSLALASLCQSYNSVICHELAHIETDECGGPEFFSNGAKLLLAGGAAGKLTPQAVREVATRRNDLHYPKPKVVSIAQSTEVGTVYSLAEQAALAQTCRELGLRLYLDGARFANALAHLGCTPAEASWRAGVDAMCLGGTKLGLAVGEAVVFFHKALAEDFEYRCKQSGQLAAKMRYLAAPWLGLLQDGAWLRHARHANTMAQTLARGLSALPGVALLHEPQANAVFVQMPAAAAQRLAALGWKFYSFIGAGGARFVCAWDTREEDVAALLQDVRECLQSSD